VYQALVRMNLGVRVMICWIEAADCKVIIITDTLRSRIVCESAERGGLMGAEGKVKGEKVLVESVTNNRITKSDAVRAKSLKISLLRKL